MGIRADRLAEEVRDLVASYFQGGHLSDPRLEGVTITAAKLSADLQNATVFFRVYEGCSVEEAQDGLGAVSGKIRGYLAKVLDVRRVPKLRFVFDESIERANRIEELLNKV